MTLREARASIKRAIEEEGPYSHNICSLVLRSVGQQYGREAANKLVDSYDLTQLYGIPKMPKDEKKDAK